MIVMVKTNMKNNCVKTYEKVLYNKHCKYDILKAIFCL